jgi:hypothetical protein
LGRIPNSVASDGLAGLCCDVPNIGCGHRVLRRVNACIVESARSKGQPLSVWWRRLERSRGMGGGGAEERETSSGGREETAARRLLLKQRLR